MKLKNELVRRLEQIPGVTHEPWPSRDDGFSTLHYQGKEIGHFHHFQELDLKLGKKLIRQEGLSHPKDSVSHPKRAAGSAYIELRFANTSQLDRIVELVNLLVESSAS